MNNCCYNQLELLQEYENEEPLIGDSSVSVPLDPFPLPHYIDSILWSNTIPRATTTIESHPITA